KWANSLRLHWRCTWRQIEGYGLLLKKPVHSRNNGPWSVMRYIGWYRCAVPRRSSHHNRGIAFGSMSDSPPDNTDVSLRRSMTLHCCDVQKNCSRGSDIKRNQCSYFMSRVFSGMCVAANDHDTQAQQPGRF